MKVMKEIMFHFVYFLFLCYHLYLFLYFILFLYCTWNAYVNELLVAYWVEICILIECCEPCASRFFPPHCSVSYIRFYFRATLSASLSRYRLIEEMYTEPETFNQDRIREYSAENISLADLYLESAHRKEDFIFRLVGNRLIF